jgi:hypothetical protein
MTHTWETIDAEAFTTLAIVVFTLVALVQLLRIVLGWAVAVNGGDSDVGQRRGVRDRATLATMLWREHRR